MIPSLPVNLYPPQPTNIISMHNQVSILPSSQCNLSRTSLQFCTHPQNQCLKEWWGISSVEVQFWKLAANFKHRVTLLVFFRQDWCGDLPPAEEKKCLEDSPGLLSLLEMLLKQHEARLVFVVVHKVMPWQSPEMKCLVSDALKRKRASEIKSS